MYVPLVCRPFLLNILYEYGLYLDSDPLLVLYTLHPNTPTPTQTPITYTPMAITRLILTGIALLHGVYIG